MGMELISSARRRTALFLFKKAERKANKQHQRKCRSEAEEDNAAGLGEASFII